MKQSVISRVPMPRQRIPLRERIQRAWGSFSESHRTDVGGYIRARTEMLRNAFGALTDPNRFAVMMFMNNLPASPMRIPSDLEVQPFVDAVESLEDFAHQCELIAHACETNPNLAAHKALVKWAEKNRQQLAA